MSSPYGVRNRSVVGHITVYTYGKMFSPAIYNGRHRNMYRKRRHQTVDRPGLISKIHHLLHIHRLMRDCSSTSLTRCSEEMHKALKRAVHTCYELKISESRLYPVGELFLELFKCSGNSYDLYSIIMNDYMPDHILYPEDSEQEQYLAFEYYLQHISNIKGDTPSEVVDLLNCDIDMYPGHYNIVPLSAALQKRCPAVVLSLLKFGANPFQVNGHPDQLDQIPTRQLIDDLNGLSMFKNTGFSKDIRSKLADQEAKAWTCLTYFRRAVPCIPLTSSTHIVTSVDEDSAVADDSDESINIELPVYSLHPKIAEIIDMDFFKIGSLKQLCRCTIRKALKSNTDKVTNVPKGISLLPLPSVLKSYLNLDID